MKRPSWFLALIAATALSTSALAGDRVLIVPFNVLNVAASQQWIGKAVQENLIADLGRTGGFSPIAFTGQVIVEDNATAARLARTANAPLAIRGAAQVVGDNVRLTAQLIDSRSGDTLRTALVTGTAADLLKVEDELANQLRGAPTAPTASATPAAGAPVIVSAPQPQIIVISQPQPAYYPNYPYDYNYPYNYYPYSFYPAVLFPVNPGGRGRDGRGGGGRGGGNGGNGGGRGGNGGGPMAQNNPGGFNPTGLPIPNNNVLPIPNNNVLPIPTNNVLPLPTNHVAPIPTISPATPRTNAGQIRSPRLVN